MRTGTLTQRIIIQRITDVQSKGKVTPTATAVATRWASIKPLSHEEKVQNQQVQDKTTHEVRLRYFPGLDGSYRFLYGDRVLNISSVIDVDELHKEHMCMCVEG